METVNKDLNRETEVKFPEKISHLQCTGSDHLEFMDSLNVWRYFPLRGIQIALHTDAHAIRLLFKTYAVLYTWYIRQE